jgi:CRP-like cAMP-binding protein
LLAFHDHPNPRETSMERLLALRRVDCFRNVPLETLERVAPLLEERAYDEGQSVSSSDGNTRHLCLLVRGSVVFEQRGRPARLIRAQATFGEASLVDENVPAASGVAREPCRLLRMSATVFNDLAREHPQIWVGICRLLARRLEAEPVLVS